MMDWMVKIGNFPPWKPLGAAAAASGFPPPRPNSGRTDQFWTSVLSWSFYGRASKCFCWTNERPLLFWTSVLSYSGRASSAGRASSPILDERPLLGERPLTLWTSVLFFALDERPLLFWTSVLDERPGRALDERWTSVLTLDERPLSSKWRLGAPFYLAPGREPLSKLAPGRPFSHARARSSRYSRDSWYLTNIRNCPFVSAKPLGCRASVMCRDITGCRLPGDRHHPADVTDCRLPGDRHQHVSVTGARSPSDRHQPVNVYDVKSRSLMNSGILKVDRW
ncbi:hypothetical protein LR48_Vigan04g028000 [Vigna angularis]|uniref:Uncharacterized protein n=1 Tax=Phaseolus angularis TaxID=3914 RepID=A0A0L9UC04_PHAAN|nr:hypothetical protein LR48_Vigan04g028000 [Vigna angularis]